jgi:ribosomal protein S18 acetylase RimI-like enzyme
MNNETIGLKLKLAVESDWEALKKIENTASSKFFHALKEEKEIKEYIKKSDVFFITLKNNIVGTISLENKGENIFNFNGLTVKKSLQRKGIGSWAVRNVLKGYDHKKTTLVVHPQNTPAIIIYLKAGFVIKEWKENIFNDGEPRLFLSRE